MLKFSEIFEFSKEKFRKILILKEFEWFEWFKWFGPSPIEPFNSDRDRRRRRPAAPHNHPPSPGGRKHRRAEAEGRRYRILASPILGDSTFDAEGGQKVGPLPTHRNLSHDGHAGVKDDVCPFLLETQPAPDVACPCPSPRRAAAPWPAFLDVCAARVSWIRNVSTRAELFVMALLNKKHEYIHQTIATLHRFCDDFLAYAVFGSFS